MITLNQSRGGWEWRGTNNSPATLLSISYFGVFELSEHEVYGARQEAIDVARLSGYWVDEIKGIAREMA